MATELVMLPQHQHSPPPSPWQLRLHLPRPAPGTVQCHPAGPRVDWGMGFIVISF